MYRQLVAFAGLAASLVQAATQPNILFVFTDDQDIELGSLDYLSAVTSRIQQEGFTFNNHYTTVALCCPARAALLRGQHAHNTNVTNVKLPGGGYQKFIASGQNDFNLPHYLKKAGYRSEYIGKIMNGYAVFNWDTPPLGWDRFDGMLDPWMYTYNTPVFSVDGATPRYYNGTYLQDVVHAKAVDRVEKLTANSTEPWFLMVAPTAPHATFNDTGDWPPVPAARHANLFPNLIAPRTPNFNPVTQNKPSWIGKLPYMDETAVAATDEYARARAQSLQSVDEMVDHLIDLLEEKGELANTVIIFSADHGYHLGNHRVPCGKTLPYKEDTHVPLIMRGPGIPASLDTDLPSNHIDIVPTLLDFAGLDKSEWPDFLDGRSLRPYFTATSSNTTSTDANDVSHVEAINVEFWGNGIVEATSLTAYADIDFSNNSYKTARVVAKDYSYMYAVWCTGESELYDTVADPYEISPIAANSSASAARLTSRLNGLMLLLKTCIGDSCRAPWSILHPDGSVRSLADALDAQYDLYYASLPSVHFDACLTSYQLPNEAPFFHSNASVEIGELTTPHQDAEDFGTATTPDPGDTIGWDGTYYGAVYEDLATIEARARDLTEQELDWQSATTKFRYG